MTDSAKRPDTDRRHYQRHSTELNVTLVSEHNFFMGLSENLSEGGLFVATHQLQPIGTIVELKFQLPMSDELIEAKGEVRWVRPFSPDIDAPTGMGVRFVDLPERDANRIRSFLKSRPPIFYDE